MSALKKISINNEAVVTVGSTLGSLVGYTIGKAGGKDGVPQMLIGGAVGSLVAMVLIKTN